MESIEGNEFEAMSALCRSAIIYQRLLVACLEARPELMSEIAQPHLDLIELAEKTVDHWKAYLEITDD